MASTDYPEPEIRGRRGRPSRLTAQQSLLTTFTFDRVYESQVSNAGLDSLNLC